MLWKILGVIGELLLTAGVLAALFAVYLLYWTGLDTHKAQASARDELRATWGAPVVPGESAVQEGDAVAGEGTQSNASVWNQGNPVALISAPNAGISELVVFEGVDQGTLRNGPGHYPGTALPGEIGNSSYAAHRDGHGAPFDNIDRLHTCDDITLETRDGIYSYKVLPDDGQAGAGEPFDCVPEGTEVPEVPGQHIVTPDRGDVVLPVGTAKMVTLTTCHPQWDNSHRLIIHAVLAGFQPKAVA